MTFKESVAFSSDGEKAMPRIVINAGPPVRIASLDCNGNAYAEKSMKLEKGDIFSTQQLNHDLRKLDDLLRKEKLYDAKVDVARIPVDGGIRIEITVDEGKPYSLKVLNVKLKPDALESVFSQLEQNGLSQNTLRITQSNLYFKLLELGYAHPDVSYEVKNHEIIFTVNDAVQQPVQRVHVNSEQHLTLSELTFYNRMALSQAQMEISEQLKNSGYLRPNIQFAYEPKGEVFQVTVDPGSQSVFGPVAISGDTTSIQIVPGIREGDVFSTKKIQKTIADIENQLKAEGYFSPEVSIIRKETEGKTIPVTFVVRTGGKKRLSALFIHGNRNIQQDTLDAMIAKKKGDRINQDDIRRIKEKLENSGYFSSVSVTPLTTDEDHLALFIRLSEQSLTTMRYGVGFNSDEGIRFSTTLIRNYLFNQQLVGTFLARVSSKREQFYFNVSGRGHFMSSVFFTRQDKNDYRFSRWGTSISYNSVFGKYANFILSLELRKNRLSNVSVPVEEIERELHPTYTFSLNSQLLYDRRDDLLYPTKGYYVSLKMEPAFDLSGKQFFFKSIAKVAWFKGRFSVAQTMGNIWAPTSYSVPIPERFFTGGVNTLRISSFEQAGPLFSTGTPMGGRFLALTNAEYHFPLTTDFDGLVFMDMGNVWGRSTGAKLSTAVKDAGIGVRARTPLGPVRIELAWNLDQSTFPSKWKLLFSIGSTF